MAKRSSKFQVKDKDKGRNGRQIRQIQNGQLSADFSHFADWLRKNLQFHSIRLMNNRLALASALALKIVGVTGKLLALGRKWLALIGTDANGNGG